MTTWTAVSKSAAPTWTSGTKSFSYDYLLMEDASYLLLEDSGKIILDQSTGTITWTASSKNAATWTAATKS